MLLSDVEESACLGGQAAAQRLRERAGDARQQGRHLHPPAHWDAHHDLALGCRHLRGDRPAQIMMADDAASTTNATRLSWQYVAALHSVAITWYI